MSDLNIRKGNPWDILKNLEERTNWFTQGAPPTESLYKILQVLFTEKEAKMVSLLPVRPFTAKKAAKIWNYRL